MTIEIKKTPQETIIEIVGRLDTITAPALDKTINEDIGEATNLVLDVKGMEYISSAGLRVLLSAQKKMQKIGSMKLINVCEEVMDVFEMTGFSRIINISKAASIVTNLSLAKFKMSYSARVYQTSENFFCYLLGNLIIFKCRVIIICHNISPIFYTYFPFVLHLRGPPHVQT